MKLFKNLILLINKSNKRNLERNLIYMKMIQISISIIILILLYNIIKLNDYIEFINPELNILQIKNNDVIFYFIMIINFISILCSSLNIYDIICNRFIKNKILQIRPISLLLKDSILSLLYLIITFCLNSNKFIIECIDYEDKEYLYFKDKFKSYLRLCNILKLLFYFNLLDFVVYFIFCIIVFSLCSISN